MMTVVTIPPSVMDTSLLLILVSITLFLFSLPTFIIIDQLHFFNTIVTIICKTVITIEDHRHMGLFELIILLPIMMAIWGHTSFSDIPTLGGIHNTIQIPFNKPKHSSSTSE